MSQTEGVAADELRSFVERIERLLEERDGIMSDVREVYAELKGRGFDKTVVGQVIATRRKREKNADDFDEKAAIYELYMSALDGTRVATHAHEPTKTTAAPLLPVPEGKGQGNHAVAEEPGAASQGESPAIVVGEAAETAGSGQGEVSSLVAAPVPPAMRVHDHAPAPLEEPDIPAFLDRRKRLDAA